MIKYLVNFFPPYLFVLVALFAIKSLPMPEHNSFNPLIRRDIAADCQSSMKAFLTKSSLAPQALTRQELNFKNLDQMKKSVWKKINGPRDLTSFNDQEYLKWVATYKNQDQEIFNLNPKTIEQKMAILEVINHKLGLLYQNKLSNLTDEIELLSLRRLKRLEKHLKKLDLSSRVYTEDLEEYTRELFLIVKGPPLPMDNYFSKDKLQISRRILRMVEEDLFRMGLKGFIARIPEKTAYSNMEKAKLFIHKALKYKITQIYFLPYKLPPSKIIKIPDALLEKILLNGLDAHEVELISFFKKQNRLDHYDNFKKLYTPIAYSLGIYYYYTVVQIN